MYGIENKMNNGKRLIALVAVLALIMCVGVVAIQSESDAYTNGVSVDANGSITVSSEADFVEAIKDTQVKEILLSDNIVMSERFTINKDLTIKSAEGDVQYSITTVGSTTINSNVTFENVILKAAERFSGNLYINFYKNNANADPITLALNSVEFDASTTGKVIYQDSYAGATTSNVVINNSVVEGITLTYTKSSVNPTATITDSNGLNVDVRSVGGDVTFGTDIKTTGSKLGTVTLYEGATLDVPSGQTLRADKITGDGAINNNGRVDAEIDNSIAYPDRDFNSSVTLGDAARIDSESAVIASANQEIIIAGDVTIVNGGYFIVNGKLTIQEGASLTIEEGGYINVGSTGIVDVQGDLIIEAGTGTPSGDYTGYSFDYKGCSMNVAGTVTLEGANSFNSTGTGVVISGLFEVEADATATFNGAEIAEGGELVINGVVDQNSTVTNNGTITVDSQGISTDGTDINGTELTINLGATGIVDIINVYGDITVNDDGLTYGQDNESVANNSEIVVTNVSGVTITETVDAEGANTTYVSGSMTVADNYNSSEVTDSTIDISAGANSNVEIAEATVLGEGVKLNVAGNLTVSGDMTATAESKMITVPAGGVLTVTGKITSNGEIDPTGDINAAKYDGTAPSVIYTTLQTAIADGATSIDLLGQNTVDADLTIPVGTTVDMIDDAELVIEQDATLTVAADDRKSGKINPASGTTDTIDVKGTLVLQNAAKSGVDDEDVLSDTSSAADPMMTYTNIYKALEDATDGDVVEITRGETLTITQDVEVKTGVTLQIPTGESVSLQNGVTATVNGMVDVNGGDFTFPEVAQEDDKSTDYDETAPGVTVVNGKFVYDDSADKTIFSQNIVGAYFYYDGRNTIMPLASVPAIADDIEGDVELYGTMELGAIDFSTYTGTGLDLVVMNDLTIESLTLGNVVFDATNAVTVTGTIVLSNGSVILDNITGITAADVPGEEDTIISKVDGNTVKAYDDPKTENVTETGFISFSGEISTAASYNAGVAVDVPADVTLTVIGGEFDVITIEGTVEGAVDFSAGKAVIAGTVNMAESKTMTATTLYAGVTVETVDEIDYIASQTTAVISGVSATTAYFGQNVEVPESFNTGYKTTSYYVEDALYVAAYTTDSVNINKIGVDLEYADFEYWMNKDGVKIDAEAEIGNPSEVYSKLNYNIIDVQVSTLPGATIYIDGQEYNGTDKITVGEHKIDVYVDPGFTGTPQIQVNGQDVANGGTFNAVAGEPVEITVSGITSIDYGQIGGSSGSSDDGLGLTDILLIILVILIVIMAIMVALRMMRS